jgi:hypothetical protein
MYDRLLKTFTTIDMFFNHAALLELGHDGLHDTEP